MKKTSVIVCFVFLTMICGCEAMHGLKSDLDGVLEKMEVERLNPKEKKPVEETISSHTTTPEEEAVPLKTIPRRKIQTPAPLEYSLTIDPVPENSTVKLMNIDERYYPGIKLSPGYYEVMVEHRGYTPYREWIKMESDKRLRITLNSTGTARVSTLSASEQAAVSSRVKTIKSVKKEAKTEEPPATPKLPDKLTGHTDAVTSLSFSPDGSTLASGSYDSTIILWNMKDGSIIRKLNYGDKVRAIAFSPNGTILASGGNDKIVKLWNAKTGEQINVLRGLTDRDYSLEFSADGRLLAAGGNNELIIWDVNSGRTEHHLVGNVAPYPRFGTVKAVAFNPQGADAQGCICAFTCLQGIAMFKPETKEVFIIHDKSMPSSVTYSPSGRYIAWGARHPHSENSYFPRFLNVDTRKIDSSVSNNDPSASPDRVFFTAFVPGGKQLIMLSYNQAVLYDIKTERIIRTFPGTTETSVTGAALSHDGKIFAATAGDNIRLWILD